MSGASISVGEHTMTSTHTHIVGLNIWGFAVLAVVVTAMALGFVPWRRRRQAGAASRGAG